MIVISSFFFKYLLVYILYSNHFRNLSVVLVLDLSEVEELWYTMQTLLDEVKKRIDHILDTAKDPMIKKTLYENARSRIPNGHEVRNIV